MHDVSRRQSRLGIHWTYRVDLELTGHKISIIIKVKNMFKEKIIMFEYDDSKSGLVINKLN